MLYSLTNKNPTLIYSNNLIVVSLVDKELVGYKNPDLMGRRKALTAFMGWCLRATMETTVVCDR